MVTTAEAKAHLRVDDSTDDTLIAGLVKGATRFIEGLCWSALVTQTWELVLDEFCSDVIDLERGPLQSITSVKYRDEDGTEQTLSSSAYWVDTARLPGRIMLKDTESWPGTQVRPDAVRVRFVVGFGAASAVPQELKQAILYVVSHLYENREPEIVGTIVARLALGVEALIAEYRLVRF